MPVNYKEYHPDWKAISLRIRKERAGDKCEQCGVLNHDYVWRGTVDGLPVYQTADCAIHSGIDGSMVDESGLNVLMESNPENKLTKIVLTVAHLDHDKANNDDANLKALCQRCHLHHDRELHKSSRKATLERKRGQSQLDLEP